MRCFNYCKNITNEKVSLAIIIGLLTVSGVGVFLWMAALKWKDMIGLSVGVLFIILAATQVLFNVMWAKFVKQQKLHMKADPANRCDKKTEFQESIMTDYPNAAAV